MAGPKAVWGIEIGQCALRAIRVRAAEDGAVELLAFDEVEHERILSQPDADRDALIRGSLQKFVSRNELAGDALVIGVPGQQTFARFCKLPPVDPKKIPELVRFEATQQIPFDISEVVWDYQVFQAPESPEVEVGIFAMRKDLIREHLNHYNEAGLRPTTIQTVPAALYNFCHHDLADELGEGSAVVLIDVGAQNTNLVIVEPHAAWMRNIPLGGNNFTEALVKAFKLSFTKAEELKRNAAKSKYARQIFQAMRPVFSDLVAEIQRSLGFYSSTHRDTELKLVVVCGNAFRLPGLQKYIENNLTIENVRRLESFSKLSTAALSDAAKFRDRILGFAATYGLALQGLGRAEIKANLLPPELARVQRWNRKRPWFIAAAACIALASALPWVRNSMDAAALAQSQDVVSQAARIVQQAEKLQSEFNKVAKATEPEKQRIEKLFELEDQRDLVPRLIALVHEALPPLPPELAAARSPEQIKQVIQSNPNLARTKRKQIFVEDFEIHYQENIENVDRYQLLQKTGGARRGPAYGGPVGGPMGRGMMAGGALGGPAAPAAGAAGKGGKPGFFVVLRLRVLYGREQSEAVHLLETEFFPRLLELGHQKGLGFWIPPTDEQNTLDPEKKNLELHIRRVEAPSGTNVAYVPGLGARGGAGGGRMAAGAPGLPTAGTTGGRNEPQYVDPVTGEDMSTDWIAEVGFKVLLGEPPEENKAQGKKKP